MSLNIGERGAKHVRLMLVSGKEWHFSEVCSGGINQWLNKRKSLRDNFIQRQFHSILVASCSMMQPFCKDRGYKWQRGDDDGDGI